MAPLTAPSPNPSVEVSCLAAGPAPAHGALTPNCGDEDGAEALFEDDPLVGAHAGFWLTEILAWRMSGFCPYYSPTWPKSIVSPRFSPFSDNGGLKP